MGQRLADSEQPSAARIVAGAVAVGSTGLFGLALSRLLFEALFPRALVLGRPLPAAALGLAAILLGWFAWRWLGGRHGSWAAVSPFLPLLLNAWYLFRPEVDLVLGRLLFAGSLWLALVLLNRLLTRPVAWRRMAPLWLAIFLAPIYWSTLGQTVGTADTFEFQVVVPRLGIVHPTGYPLYLLLSKPFALLPAGTVAWRVNLATAVFGLLAALVLYWLSVRLSGRVLPALLAAVTFGLTPTFWSQAVAAEVYSLHALVVASALFLMGEVVGWSVTDQERTPPTLFTSRTAALLLALTLGLGLANHLTTLILLPPAGLTLVTAWRAGRFSPTGGAGRDRLGGVRLPLAWLALLVAPLALYAYLPIRWLAVNGQPMGLGRFIDWVIGGRFQGALQLDAWLTDSTRYEVVGRLLWNEWQPGWMLLLAAVGVAWLLFRKPVSGLGLLITWLGFLFYALNYHVPDLSVFLIPAHLVTAVWWAVGLAAILNWVAGLGKRWPVAPVQGLVVLLAFGPPLVTAASTWTVADADNRAGRTGWARAVLDLPLEEGAAILADSDKFPPLFYLQQAEGQRPDLDIMVLPDETAYRAELLARLATGQPVYLARFLPGLEGIYYLRSLGPLTAVSSTPLGRLPDGATATGLDFGPVELLAYRLEAPGPYDARQAAVTMYWRSRESLEEVLYVYLRWAGPGLDEAAQGQHPVNNTYPTVAWRPGEIVADFHTLPLPLLNEASALTLQVALGRPFATADELRWQTITQTAIELPGSVDGGRNVRIQAGPLLLKRVDFPETVRPQSPVLVQAEGYGMSPQQLAFDLRAAEESAGRGLEANGSSPTPGSLAGFVTSTQLEAGSDQGNYRLTVAQPGAAALCSWLARPATACQIGQVVVSGQPLPEGAINFDDQIALRSVDLAETTLQPGGRLAVKLTWQALADMGEDYTVFVQVLDGSDQIVGQVDSWPLQGTYPTGSWQPGEVVTDPYQVPLAADLAPGPYELHVGLYLLETLRRLPVLDRDGQAVDDKLVVPGLVMPTD